MRRFFVALCNTVTRFRAGQTRIRTRGWRSAAYWDSQEPTRCTTARRAPVCPGHRLLNRELDVSIRINPDPLHYGLPFFKYYDSAAWFLVGRVARLALLRGEGRARSPFRMASYALLLARLSAAMSPRTFTLPTFIAESRSAATCLAASR